MSSINKKDKIQVLDQTTTVRTGIKGTKAVTLEDIGGFINWDPTAPDESTGDRGDIAFNTDNKLYICDGRLLKTADINLLDTVISGREQKLDYTGNGVDDKTWTAIATTTDGFMDTGLTLDVTVTPKGLLKTIVVNTNQRGGRAGDYITIAADNASLGNVYPIVIEIAEDYLKVGAGSSQWRYVILSAV